jgi:hypothetical protein
MLLVKKSFGIPSRWDCNIAMELREYGCKNVKRIDVTQGGVRCWKFAVTVANPGIHKNKEFIINYTGNTLTYG